MATVTKYPRTFPHPLVAEYSYISNMGVLRTGMESGSPRQRRRFRNMPHVFSFGFVIPVHDLDMWHTWINGNAYDWIEMDLVSYQMTDPRACATPHYIRFISDISFNALSPNYIHASVSAELSPISAGAPIVDYGDWIIGGTPAAPSLPDWIIGGTPSAPSLNFTNPGTPNNPAVVV